jgi:hypothetical protein
MNEQIGKLISEAIKAIPDHVDFDLPKEFTEKFAELIVRECAEVVYSRSGHATPQDLYEHFGVDV